MSPGSPEHSPHDNPPPEPAATIPRRPTQVRRRRTPVVPLAGGQLDGAPPGPWSPLPYPKPRRDAGSCFVTAAREGALARHERESARQGPPTREGPAERIGLGSPSDHPSNHPQSLQPSATLLPNARTNNSPLPRALTTEATIPIESRNDRCEPHGPKPNHHQALVA